MARRRQQAEERPIERSLSDAQRERVRTTLLALAAGEGDRAHHLSTLEAIHAEVGRVREFMLWELDRVTSPADFERALAEEHAGGFRQWAQGVAG